MCGIVGLHCWGTQPQVTRAYLETMCEAIIHRGPDDQGIFVEEQIGLGMRRLSIIDVAGGHQPIQNENGDITVIFNGEIYNYQTLRQDLLRHDHTFQTKTDTEVIVHAYEDDGLDCVKRFIGRCSVFPNSLPYRLIFPHTVPRSARKVPVRILPNFSLHDCGTQEMPLWNPDDK